MGMVLDWVNSLQPGQRKKPSKEIRQQLFDLIRMAIRDEKSSCYDCVSALMKLSPTTVTPFYKEVYARFPKEVRQVWDNDLYSWAGERGNLRTMEKRIVPILLVKLEALQDISELSGELRWLLKHDDSHALAQSLGSKGKSAQLRKLLQIQSSDWQGREQPLLGALDAVFGANPDKALHEKYAEFQNALTGTSESPGNVSAAHSEPEPVDSKPVRGVGPLELLCALEKLQVEQMCAHEKQIQDMLGTMARQQEQYDSFSARLTELEAALPEMSARKRALEAQLAENRAQVEALEIQLAAHRAQIEELETLSASRRALIEELKAQVISDDARIRELEAQNQKTSKDMGDIQQMFDNSSNQKLDEFKQKLASDLRGIMKDFSDDYSDFSDAEKAALYSELLRDLIDRLNRRGINIEEN